MTDAPPPARGPGPVKALGIVLLGLAGLALLGMFPTLIAFVNRRVVEVDDGESLRRATVVRWGEYAGVLDGSMVVLDRNTGVRVRGQHRDGLRFGHWTYFRPDGTILRQERWDGTHKARVIETPPWVGNPRMPQFDP